MVNVFDPVARWYDALARFMFGSQWEEIQRAPAYFLKDKKKVLIAGGGTGKLLDSLPASAEVTYLELSGKMIEKAQTRLSDAKIAFIQADFLSWQSPEHYDALVFIFFLDSFNEANVRRIAEKAGRLLQPDGELHVIDFQKAHLLQNMLIRAMYRFFRTFTRLEGKRLLPLDHLILQSGWRPVWTNQWRKWIFYRIYRKPESAS